MATTHNTVVGVADDGTSPVGTDEWNLAHIDKYQPTEDVTISAGMSVVNTDPYILDSGRLLTLSSGAVIWTDAPRWARADPGVFNVKNPPYNAVGDGYIDDTAAINAAVTDIQATPVGGVLYFPPGIYLYSGAGILNNPIASAVAPLVIAGAGPSVSTINFVSVANAECIKLTSQATVGSGHNYGSGVTNITIIPPAGKDGITISSLEFWTISNVRIYGGANAINVSESRLGGATTVLCDQWTGTGVKITGTTFSYNRYENMLLNGTGASQWGFDYSSATTFDGGLFLKDVTINSAGQGGFRFAKTTAGVAAIFLFAESCVADGTFGADGWLLQNISSAHLVDCWSVNHGNNLAGFTLDGSTFVTMMGGTASADTGASAGDIQFKNSCANVVIFGVHTTGLITAYKTDGTTHTNVAIDAAAVSAGAFSNTAENLLSGSGVRRKATPFAVLTSNIKGGSAEFALEDATSGSSRSMRIEANAVFSILNSARSAIAFMVADGGTIMTQVQTPVFAASFTPGASGGGIIKLGLLTANLTVNAPTTVLAGETLSFHFQQDGTGGRTVTWNAVFIKTWSDAGNTLNTRSSISFQYDGTNWLQIGAQRLWA